MHMASAANETRNVLAAALLGAIALGGGALAAAAAGGTATPPLPGRGNLPLLATRAPFVPAPNFAAPLQDIKGFTVSVLCRMRRSAIACARSCRRATGAARRRSMG